MIGGAAGAFPPMIGWPWSPVAWRGKALSLPSSFSCGSAAALLALALLKTEDYARAVCPCCRSAHGADATRMRS